MLCLVKQVGCKVVYTDVDLLNIYTNSIINNNKNKNNNVNNALQSWSVDVKRSLRVLLASRCRGFLRLMQRSVISSTLHIARTFRVAA